MAYLPLSTTNLPDPVIDPAQGSSPSDYFATTLYTGNGSTQSITGVGHQPDFLWFKNRNSTQVHQLFDVVRGVANSLRSNGTDAENTDSPNDRLTSFDSDGFSLGADGNPNGSSNTYVAWSWKANGSGVSNTDGSITSTVSANTKAGFSIVSYTGNGNNGATIGHGLSSAPDMIITKSRTDSGYNWNIYHSSLAANKVLLFSTDPALTPSFGYYGTVNSTIFTATQGTTNNENLNKTGSEFIAYCFHSVEGYSKFGSYTGNGSTDGTFVYTGFRPAFLLYKRTDSTGNWLMDDSKTQTVNPDSNYLLANSADAEGDSGSNSAGHIFDMLSNGFKMRNTNSERNASGGTYIYMAFAENPFKYSNAR